VGVIVGVSVFVGVGDGVEEYLLLIVGGRSSGTVLPCSGEGRLRMVIEGVAVAAAAGSGELFNKDSVVLF